MATGGAGMIHGVTWAAVLRASSRMANAVAEQRGQRGSVERRDGGLHHPNAWTASGGAPGPSTSRLSATSGTGDECRPDRGEPPRAPEARLSTLPQPTRSLRTPPAPARPTGRRPTASPTTSRPSSPSTAATELCARRHLVQHPGGHEHGYHHLQLQHQRREPRRHPGSHADVEEPELAKRQGTDAEHRALRQIRPWDEEKDRRNQHQHEPRRQEQQRRNVATASMTMKLAPQISATRQTRSRSVRFMRSGSIL